MEKKNLKKMALRYSGLVSAVLGAQQANAQVRYVDINDVTLNTNGAEFDLNIDNDTNGIVDYRIIQYVDTTEFNISGSFIQARGTARNQVVGLDYANYYYPFQLNLGAEVGPDTVFGGLGTSRNWGQLALEINDTTYPNDQFGGGVTDGFIGLRFGATVNDTVRNFYGWLRVDVAADLKSITIKDYAYNESYDSTILAGEGSPLLDLEQFESELPELSQQGKNLVVALPKSFASAEGELIISDLSGRELRNRAFTGRDFKFPLESLPKGVLIATVVSNGSTESIKIVSY